MLFDIYAEAHILLCVTLAASGKCPTSARVLLGMAVGKITDGKVHFGSLQGAPSLCLISVVRDQGKLA